MIFIFSVQNNMKWMKIEYWIVAFSCGSASWGMVLGSEIAKERWTWIPLEWREVAGSIGGGFFGILFPVALPTFYLLHLEQEEKQVVERRRWEKRNQEQKETLDAIYQEWNKEIKEGNVERIDSFIQSFKKQ